MAKPATLMVLKEKEKVLQDEIEKFRANQKDIQRCISSRGKLETQLNENKTVKEEMDVLEEGAVVYKLIGPVLVQQELSEAKQTVNKRLEYIKKEIARYNQTIQDLDKKQESMTENLAKLQQDYQQTLMKAGGLIR